MKIASCNLSKDVLGSLTVRPSALFFVAYEMRMKCSYHIPFFQQQRCKSLHVQVEEFLHREQNAQIAELRKAASDMIQKVPASVHLSDGVISHFALSFAKKLRQPRCGMSVAPISEL